MLLPTVTELLSGKSHSSALFGEADSAAGCALIFRRIISPHSSRTCILPLDLFKPSNSSYRVHTVLQDSTPAFNPVYKH